MNAGSSNGGRTPPLMRSCSSPAVYGKLISLIQFWYQKEICIVWLHTHIEHTTAACQLISTLFHINQFQFTHTPTIHTDNCLLIFHLAHLSAVKSVVCLSLACIFACPLFVLFNAFYFLLTLSLPFAHLTFALPVLLLLERTRAISLSP